MCARGMPRFWAAIAYIVAITSPIAPKSEISFARAYSFRRKLRVAMSGRVAAVRIGQIASVAFHHGGLRVHVMNRFGISNDRTIASASWYISLIFRCHPVNTDAELRASPERRREQRLVVGT